MYFESRGQAGRILAEQLVERYRYEDCAVMALGDGSVLVAEQIAAQLHCVLTLLVTEEIEIPGENLSFGAVSQGGGFTYNAEFTQGQIDGYTSEFHGYLSDEKRKAFQKINRLLGDGGTIDLELLRHRNIILVSDGLNNISELGVALDFLKPIQTQKIIIASPIATIPVVDLIHVKTDEVHILDVKSNYLATDHYYEVNDIPSHEETVKLIGQIIMRWQ